MGEHDLDSNQVGAKEPETPVPAATPAPEPAGPRLLRALVAGAVGGLVGTTTMTLAIGAAQKMGLLGKLPPKKITTAMLKALHIHVDEGTKNVLSGIAHYGFGAAMGSLFGLAHLKTKDMAPAALQGVAFGTLVWAISYEIVVPALGIMPRPSFDRPARPTSMVLGHWVYGATLGAVVGAAWSLWPAPAETSAEGASAAAAPVG